MDLIERAQREADWALTTPAPIRSGLLPP